MMNFGYAAVPADDQLAAEIEIARIVVIILLYVIPIIISFIGLAQYRYFINEEKKYQDLCKTAPSYKEYLEDKQFQGIRLSRFGIFLILVTGFCHLLIIVGSK